MKSISRIASNTLGGWISRAPFSIVIFLFFVQLFDVSKAFRSRFSKRGDMIETKSDFLSIFSGFFFINDFEAQIESRKT